MSDEQNLRTVLFNLIMHKNWEALVEIYKDSRLAHRFMLTESVGTAFHIAISSYNAHSPKTSHKKCIEEMFSLMKECGSLSAVLRMQNVKGDTPLHLAAAVEWEAICVLIAAQDLELIRIRYVNGETPLFVAAHCGNIKAFFSLHRIYNHGRDKPDESLCRRKDGNTILHSAISGEYFGLADLIIDYDKNLLTYVNVDGETPLHVLARKPNLFKSSSQLGFYEYIIYRCVFVNDDDLKKQPKHNRRAVQINVSSKEKVPENYWTCVDIFSLLWYPIYKSYKACFSRSKKQKSTNDVEDQSSVEHGKSFLAGCSRSKIQNCAPTDGNGENQTNGAEEKSKYYGSFPPNCTTCISIFKLPRKILLILGIEFLEICKIQKRKVGHSHAMKIMNEPSYKYDSNGQHPVQEPSETFKIPHSPPNVEEHHFYQSPEANNRRTSSVKHDNRKIKINQKSDSVVKDTPLLVAAKMGIREMVEKILNAVPGAIQDLDSHGKNVLMVAAENRQVSVFDFLLSRDPPDYVFHHVDNDGNSILHLAAKLGEKQPWRISGAALQMQCEILWYKHVKRSVPSLCFTHHNAKGETPMKIFTQTHEHLVKSGNEWLIKTSESCSVVAALIATVAFATSATVPGGLDQLHGHPILRDHKAFDIFSIASPVALCLSITGLFYSLTIVSWRFGESDFKRDMTRKLLMGLNCLFSGIAAMLLSFGAGHTLVLREKLRTAAVSIYAAAMIPVMFFAMEQLPLFVDLLWAAYVKVPLRSYKFFHQ